MARKSADQVRTLLLDLSVAGRLSRRIINGVRVHRLNSPVRIYRIGTMGPGHMLEEAVAVLTDESSLLALSEGP